MQTGDCSHCGKEFSYYLVHNGFNNTSYGYCDTCGCTAFFDTYRAGPQGVRPEPYRKIHRDVESYLRPCACGGQFTARASPRCPRCREELSAVAAAAWIEGNAPGTAKGWRWQMNWDDLYCIVVESRSVDNPWKPELLRNDAPVRDRGDRT
jgi:hypothetical protein